MDLLTIILIILFFVVPVIQQVLEQARRQGGPPPSSDVDPEDDEFEGLPPGRDEIGAGDRELPGRQGGWAEDWTPWPSSTREPEADEASWGRQTRDREPPAWLPAPEPPPPLERPLPEPIRPAEVEIRKATEISPVPADQVAVSIPKRTRSVRRRPGPTRTRTQPPVRRHLSGSQELRRALILKEVLGPPAALRPPDQLLPLDPR